MLLFAGGDWAEDHHDVEFQDEQGQVLGTARLPEGVDGVARFHELAASFLPDDGRPGQVMVCIETDRGPWVRALAVAGYRVYAVNPRQAARHRELLSLSGAKSDQADAHTLADMVRTRRHQLRQVAADRTSRATTNPPTGHPHRVDLRQPRDCWSITIRNNPDLGSMGRQQAHSGGFPQDGADAGQKGARLR